MKLTQKFPQEIHVKMAICLAILAFSCTDGKRNRDLAVGPCLPDGGCPAGNTCVDDECYPDEDSPTRRLRRLAPYRKVFRRDVSAVSENVIHNGTIEAIVATTVQPTIAEKAAPSIGECVNGLCPMDYKCIDNLCRKLITDGKTPIGPCINEKCPTNFYCSSADYKCYP